MSIQLDCKAVADDSKKEELHHIPCKIDYNGSANVKQYFKCNIRPSTDTNGYDASFRGRPLNGEKKEVPSGYTGVVLKESHKVYSEDEERKFKVIHTFNDYMHWNLDLPPSDNDKIASVIQWLDIAKVLHEPMNDKENDTP